MRGITLSPEQSRRNDRGGINSDVIVLSQRFALPMGEYDISISDGVIAINDSRRRLRETPRLQQIRPEMKLHLEREAG